MIFLRSLSVNLPDKKEYPFTLPVLQNLESLAFDSPITFFIGENGSGKSTILEAIAAGLRTISIGSDDISRDKTLEPARNLGKNLKFISSRKPKRGFFFRTEDFFGFTKRIIREKQELEELESHYSSTLSGYGKTLATGMARGQKAALDAKYGQNPDGFSHGEALLNVLRERLVPNGFYLMDEPETPLSPLRQLAFISLLKEMVEKDCQFIIATHSPILMAFPEAQIYSFDDENISSIDYESVEHVKITKSFLNNPDTFLRRL